MKTASRIFLVFGIMVFFTGMTLAQTASTAKPVNTSTKQATAAPGKFVDADKNGVCDNHQAKGGCAQGKNYIDKNSDGKCDNCGTAGNCKGSGNCCAKGDGNKSGCGQGKGKGNCCGQGQQNRNGCAPQGNNTPAAQPNK